ncbi:DNA helicase UvrD [Candidatus Uhrbacteria bacterium]|nr:DNA helicase UvrD [Candidatus Uhrbacteria bacterium]
MRLITDLHIHSRFSRACSKELTIPNIAAACARKGIHLVTTGDCTHPQWRQEIGALLTEDAPGIFRLHSPHAPTAAAQQTQFLLGTELSCIYKHDGKVRRVHHLVLFPSLAALDHLIAQLEEKGCNLRSDGRPILGISSAELLERCLTSDPRTLVIPAHAWTPWFAVFGSESGYDALAECFGSLAPHIVAIETGLSSDPAMNRRLSSLDGVALVSSSDAHSLEKLAREATVLELTEYSFAAVTAALRSSASATYDAHAPNRIIETIEFFPEEGKYHDDGHRACGVRCTPSETRRHRGQCPQCGKPMTVGVMHRVDKLADRGEDGALARAPGFRRIVPLDEIISEACNVRSLTPRVRAQRERLLDAVGNEFYVLLDAPLEHIARSASPEVVEAIRRVRAGELDIAPGYDGEFGTVHIFTPERPRPVAMQHSFFS